MQFFSERQRDGGCDATRHRLSITIEFWNGLIATIPTNASLNGGTLIKKTMFTSLEGNDGYRVA